MISSISFQLNFAIQKESSRSRTKAETFYESTGFKTAPCSPILGWSFYGLYLLVDVLKVADVSFTASDGQTL
jgi:hypothetical protein